MDLLYDHAKYGGVAGGTPAVNKKVWSFSTLLSEVMQLISSYKSDAKIICHKIY